MQTLKLVSGTLQSKKRQFKLQRITSDIFLSCLSVLIVQLFGPVTQSMFLNAIGIESRFKVLLFRGKINEALLEI